MNEMFWNDKPEGVDTPEEKANYVGKQVHLHDGTKGKILDSFWSTPCGYWTQCFNIERYGYIMRNQVSEFIDP